MAHLPSAQAGNTVSPECMHALPRKVAGPGRLVSLAHHVHPVQQQQPRLCATPLWNRGVAG